MTENPYRSPSPPALPVVKNRVRWGQLCLRSLAVTLVCFAIQLAIIVFKPFGVRDDIAPMSPARQAMAGLALINLILFAAALVTTVVATVGVILAFIRRRI